MYRCGNAARPRNWMLYTLVVLIIVLLVGWSSSDIQFTEPTLNTTYYLSNTNSIVG